MLTTILIVVGAVVLFIVTTLLNIKTKVPEGVELPDKCDSCTQMCSHMDNPLTEEVIKQINEDIHCKEHSESTGENNER